VWRTAKQTTIDVLVQPEQEAAQPLNESEWARRIFGGRSHDQDERCGSGLLNVFYAFAQPGGNGVAIRDEQKAERRARIVMRHHCAHVGWTVWLRRPARGSR